MYRGHGKQVAQDFLNSRNHGFCANLHNLFILLSCNNAGGIMQEVQHMASERKNSISLLNSVYARD